MFEFLLKYLDWIGMIFLYISYFRTAQLKIDNWFWTAMGCLCLTVFGFSRGAYGLAIGEGFFILIAYFGYVSWKKKNIK
jgi:hypothetical protein